MHAILALRMRHGAGAAWPEAAPIKNYQERTGLALRRERLHRNIEVYANT